MTQLIVRSLIAIMISLPVSVVLTLLTMPCWSWFEATYGIESVGHSGPADWCFATMWGLTSLIAVAMCWRWSRKSRL